MMRDENRILQMQRKPREEKFILNTEKPGYQLLHSNTTTQQKVEELKNLCN